MREKTTKVETGGKMVNINCSLPQVYSFINIIIFVYFIYLFFFFWGGGRYRGGVSFRRYRGGGIIDTIISRFL